MTTTIARPQSHKSWIDLNQNELRNAIIQNLGADPGSPIDGQIWYRTDTDRYRIRANGVTDSLATLSDVGAAGIPGTIFDAKGDLIAGTGADTYAKQTVGSDGTVLVANSAQTTGLNWRRLTEADFDLGATDRLVGRDTAGAGAAEEIALSADMEFTGASAIRLSAWSGGDIAKSAGATSATINANAVDNTKAADMAQSTIKGRASGAGTGDPTDLTAAQVKTILALVAADISNFDTQVRTSRLDQMAAPTAAVSMNSQKITSLADGTAVSDAINLGQLQAAIEGRQWKDPVATATTGALPNTPTYNSGAGTLTSSTNAALAAQAGHTLTVGERLLVKDQASSFQNGIYSVTAVGSGAAQWVLTRVADASTAAELSNATVLVEANDSTLRGKAYTQQNTLADLTAATQNWTVTGDNNTYTADGSTLQLVGNQFSILDAELLALAGLTSAADRLPYFTGSGTASLATFTAAGRALVDDADASAQLTTLGFSTFIKTLVDDADAATARATLGATGKYETDIGNASLTSFTITHSLNTRAVSVVVYENTTFEEWDVDVVHSTTTTVTVVFTGHTPTANQFHVVVIG